MRPIPLPRTNVRTIIKVPFRTDKANHLTRPEQAIAHLNKVIASGGDLAAIRQAVAIVAGALERAGLGKKRTAGQQSQWKHDGAKAKRT